MKILITGGCGFIGSNFINYLLNNIIDNVDNDLLIYNIDCLNYCSSESNIKLLNVSEKQRYKFIKGNITDKNFISYILTEYNIDVIIHFAAQSHVDDSFKNSLNYTMDNIYGTHVLLQCCLEYGQLKKFIHFSTDEVYGEVDINHEGCQEKSILNPTNPYAATKAGAEFIVKSYHHSFKLPIIIVRCNNVYGLNQYPEKLIPKFITMLKEGKKLTIHGKGESRRNFIWMDDVNRAVLIILKHGEIGEIYNIGTSQEYSVIDVAKILITKITKDDNINDYIEYVEDRPFNDFRYAINTQKLVNLGWKEIDNNFELNMDIIVADIMKK